MGEDIECEGRPEYLLARDFEADQLVTFYFEQCPALLFEYEAIIHLYTPDFFVQRAGGGLTAYDAKGKVEGQRRRYRPSRYPRPPRAWRSKTPASTWASKAAAEQARLEAVANAFAFLKIEFQIVRPDDLLAEPRRSNVDRLLDRTCNWVTVEKIRAVRAILRRSPSMSVGELASVASLTEAELMSLIASREVRIDINQEWTAETAVSDLGTMVGQ